MAQSICIIVRYSPECFQKFRSFIDTHYPNVEDEDNIIEFIKDQSENEDMREDGCMISIEENELEFEEGGPVNGLACDNDNNIERKLFVDNCDGQVGGTRKKSRKRSHKRVSKQKRKSKRKKSVRRKSQRKNVKKRRTRTKRNTRANRIKYK